MTNHEAALRRHPDPGRPADKAVRRGPLALSAAAAILLHVAIGAALIIATDGPETPPVPIDQTVAMVFDTPPPAEPAPAEPSPEPVIQQATEPPPESLPEPPPSEKTAAEAPPRRPPAAAPRKSPPARTVATPAAPAPSAPPAQPPPEAAIATDWQRSLGSWLEAHKSYPYEARRRGAEGRVGLRFTVERSGRVMAVAVVSSAGSIILDDAAAALIRNATLPPFTATMPQTEVTITVQIRYALAN